MFFIDFYSLPLLISQSTIELALEFSSQWESLLDDGLGLRMLFQAKFQFAFRSSQHQAVHFRDYQYGCSTGTVLIFSRLSSDDL